MRSLRNYLFVSLTDEHSPLVDTYKFAKKKKGVDYSFHNFGKKKMTDRSKIDFIFVSPGIKVKQCVIPQEEDEGRNMELEYKKSAFVHQS